MESKVRNVRFQMTLPESSPRDIVHSLFRWPPMKFAVVGCDNATDILEGYLEFTCSLRFSTTQRPLLEGQVYLPVESVTDTILRLRGVDFSDEFGTFHTSRTSQ